MGSGHLRHFSDSELILTQDEAFRVLRFFWIEPGVQPGNLTNEDRGFAQALLVEAIDASHSEGYVQIIFDKFFMKVPTDFSKLKDMVKDFLKEAAKHWFEHATGKDLEDPKIYENVRKTLQWRFRSTWVIRQQGGSLDY